MRTLLLSALLTTVLSVSGAARARGDTLFVADRYLVTAAVGARITAKFEDDSSAARTAMLRLDTPIATINGKPWVLGDVLVSLGVNGNGVDATWTVAGPRNVIEGYLATLRTIARDRHPIYDFGVQSLVVRCACN